MIILHIFRFFHNLLMVILIMTILFFLIFYYKMKKTSKISLKSPFSYYNIHPQKSFSNCNKLSICVIFTQCQIFQLTLVSSISLVKYFFTINTSHYLIFCIIRALFTTYFNFCNSKYICAFTSASLHARCTSLCSKP